MLGSILLQFPLDEMAMESRWEIESENAEHFAEQKRRSKVGRRKYFKESNALTYYGHIKRIKTKSKRI